MPDTTPMHVDETAPFNDTTSTLGKTSLGNYNQVKKKPITVEDSLDVISELISEIQSTDNLVLNLPTPPVPPPSFSSPPREKSSFRFSLAKTRSAINTTSFLPLLKRFLHCLLSTTSVHFLPIRNDNQIPPLTTSSQINELSIIGSKLYFKAS
jgi:hypothetical protein